MATEKTIINATGHSLMLLDEDHKIKHVFPATDLRPRVSQESKSVGSLNGFDLTHERFSSLEGLPAEVEGTYYIVSVICAQAGLALGRHDLLVVAKTVRETLPDQTTRIIGFKSLSIL